jgi:hypothetical protein
MYLIANICSEKSVEKLIRKAAEMGYAPAQAWLSTICGTLREKLAWAEKAAAQGDRDGLFMLGFALLSGSDADRARALRLFADAAELGHVVAPSYYFRCAVTFTGGMEALSWLGQTFVRKSDELVSLFVGEASLHRARISGYIVFEVGESLRFHPSMIRKRSREGSNLSFVELALAFHRESCECAKQAIYCWIWVARRNKIVIAKMLWADRIAWAHGMVHERNQKFARIQK